MRKPPERPPRPGPPAAHLVPINVCADLLGVSPGELLDLAAAGALAVEIIKGRRYVDLDEAEAAIAARDVSRYKNGERPRVAAPGRPVDSCSGTVPTPGRAHRTALTERDRTRE